MFRTLHHVFGADKMNTMYNGIITTLKEMFYSGDGKNFTYDKYCTVHVEQHNRHASLVDYNVTPLEESMKIHYFEKGIRDPTLESTRNPILVNLANFPDLGSEMQLYVTSADTSQQGHNLCISPPSRVLTT